MIAAALDTPWLIPLTKGAFSSNVTRRLTGAELVERQGIQYIDAALPLNRDTRRIHASTRVKVRTAAGEYWGIVEHTRCDRDYRYLTIRINRVTVTP